MFHNSTFKANSVPPKVEKKVTFNPDKDVSNSSSSQKIRGYTPPKRLGKAMHLVNFVLEPVGYRFDPLQEIFVNPSVEYGLDNFYFLESIGIKEEDSPE